MQQAVLPERLEKVAIRDMIEDESGYAVPWAMWADTSGYLWLNGSYHFGKEYSGTKRMKITKVNGGFEVNTSQCKDQRWASGEKDSAWDTVRLPVVKLI